MFTGIVESVGQVVSARRSGSGFRLRVRARFEGSALVLGESISVAGVCLTVARQGGGWFEADCSPETLRSTTLGTLAGGSPVNLERALQPSGRLGGHFVQGHVDGVGEVVGVRREGEGQVIAFTPPPEVAPYLVLKGSVAVDGVSLTVSGLDSGSFEVTLIPHTLAATTLTGLRRGSRVNLEADLLGRYVRAFVGAPPPTAP